ncbi:MAG: helix-turn-helix domain-containing protein [Clostridia bacterium]|nr:helix-turn-helix domain-containing protein [Clostridia bacterium]
METLSQLMEDKSQNRVELIKNIFCEKLRNIRIEKTYSQKTVAEKLGIHISTYANWEQGRREPSIFDIYNLMYVLDIDANELFLPD